MKEWFSAAEIAAQALPDLPATKSAVVRYANRGDWQGRINLAGAALARKRKGRGGGWEYHYSVFPSRAQAALLKRAKPSAGADAGGQDTAGAAGTPSDTGAADAWAHYERLPDGKKAKARARLDTLDDIETLYRGGWPKDQAVHEVSRQRGVGTSSIYNWFKTVDGKPRADRLPYLAPRHTGRTRTVACDPAAWEFLKRAYLSDEQRQFQYCYELLQDAADEHGWTIPSARTLERRVVSDIPRAIRVFWREGAEAASRLYPHQERDRTGFHAMQAVNADGHRFDVFVKWPGIEKPVRPLMLAVQDLYSNKFVGWRVDLNETSELVRLAFRDMLEEYGIPEMAFLDNGRGFAAKCITGGTPTRYRFKVKAEEPLGVLPALGVDVRWTRPYSGQSKPIERAFGELCEKISKHPEFEGAYTGNSPDAKPESYMSRAVDLDTFLRVVGDGIRAYNARPNRNTRVCGRKLSFDQAFSESYANSLIGKASPEALRMCLLAAQSVRASAQSGSVKLMGNRYWSEQLVELAGQNLTIRFDPEDLQIGVHIYLADGRYIGFAECVHAAGFANAEEARDHARKRNAYRRALRDAAEIERSMTLQEMIALMPDELDAPDTPAAKTIRLVTGNTALAPAPADADPRMEDEEFSRSFTAGLRMIDGGLDG